MKESPARREVYEIALDEATRRSFILLTDGTLEVWDMVRHALVAEPQQIILPEPTPEAAKPCEGQREHARRRQAMHFDRDLSDGWYDAETAHENVRSSELEWVTLATHTNDGRLCAAPGCTASWQLGSQGHGDQAAGDKQDMGQLYNTLLFPDRPLSIRFLPR